jgi:hypothetical protein
VFAAVKVGTYGQGDMAVCQAFGSNTFDILIAFALLWKAKIPRLENKDPQINKAGD